jgi:folate-binding protein YgfZ
VKEKSMTEFETALNKDIVVELANYGLIKAAGEDAQTFLHNQFTNDLQQGVTENSSQLSAYCSPKGRVLALFRVFQANDAYYLSMPGELVEPTLKRLRMFVLMSKVTLEDVSDSMHQLGVAGRGIDQKLIALAGHPREEMNGVSTEGNISILTIPGPVPRCQLVGPNDEIASLKNKLATFAAEVSPAAWELLDIHAGIPIIKTATIEAFVPQMINLQAIDGLSFKKGCFPGQEIVARMEYLGKLKRRMYLAHSPMEQAPAAGDDIYVHGTEPRKVGEVVLAQSGPEGGIDLLLVAEIEAAEGQPLHLSEKTESTLELRPLPYSLEA